MKTPRYRCWYCAGFINEPPFIKNMNDSIMYLDSFCTRKLARAMVEYLLTIDGSPEQKVAQKAFGGKEEEAEP